MLGGLEVEQPVEQRHEHQRGYRKIDVFRKELTSSWFRGSYSDKVNRCMWGVEVGRYRPSHPSNSSIKKRMTVPWVPPAFRDVVAAVGMEQQPLTTKEKDGRAPLLWELVMGFSPPLNCIFPCHGPKLSVSLTETHSLLAIHSRSDWQCTGCTPVCQGSWLGEEKVRTHQVLVANHRVVYNFIVKGKPGGLRFVS